MTFVSRHNADTLGPLRADPSDITTTSGGELVSLADVVGFVCERDGLPKRPAVDRLVTALEAASPMPVLYLTQRDTWAQRLTDDYEWRPRVEARKGGVQTVIKRAPAYSVTSWRGDGGAFREAHHQVVARAADAGLYGVVGALQVLRMVWGAGDSKAGRSALARHGVALDRLAISTDLAAYLFGWGNQGLASATNPVAIATSELAAVASAEADSRVAQPKGGAWPHTKGTTWSEAEKEAMRSMRNSGMTDAEIAEIAECKRQIVAQQIGSSVVARGILSKMAFTLKAA